MSLSPREQEVWGHGAIGFKQDGEAEAAKDKVKLPHSLVNTDQQVDHKSVPSPNGSLDSNEVEIFASMPSAISIWSLLNQFNNVNVRADFINGRFGATVNPDWLPNLDEVSWTLMPRWQGRSFSKQLQRSSLAAETMKKLIARSEDPFKLASGDEGCTYAEWMDILDLLAKNSYWDMVPPENRCGHPTNEPTVNVAQVKEKRADISNTSSRKKTKRKVTKKIEEIILSSDSSSDDSEEEDDSSEEDSSSESSPDRSFSKSKKRASDSRKAVAPPPFELNGKVHLKDYLRSFEEYFENAFIGNSHDKCLMLSSFLTGDLLKVYNAKGGHKLKFRKMQSELLSYYHKLKIGGKSYWRKQLDTVSPEEGENLEIFGMRLSEIAQSAYPNDEKTCARQLRNTYMKRLPQLTVSKILDAERAQKAASCGKKKYLSFSAITQIAADLQASNSKPVTVMWSSQVATSASTDFNCPATGSDTKVTSSSNHNNSAGPSNSSPPREFRQSRQPQQAQGAQRQNRAHGNCFSCNKPGHHARNCWRAKGVCLICGGNHDIEKCPRYDPDRRAASLKNNQALN